MTPPLDVDAACSGCFLYEWRGGRTCPTLGDLVVAETRRRVEVLCELVFAEGSDLLSPVELVRREADQPHRELTAVVPLALPRGVDSVDSTIDGRALCRQTK